MASSFVCRIRGGTRWGRTLSQRTLRALPPAVALGLTLFTLHTTGFAQATPVDRRTARDAAANQASSQASQAADEATAEERRRAQRGLNDTSNQARDQANEALDDATREARDTAERAIDDARDRAEQAVSDVTDEGKRRVEEAGNEALSRLQDSLSALESDNIIFGIFPNTAGFMDARLHLRRRYLQFFSAGLYLDYTTGRDSAGDGVDKKSDRLIKEYRAQADLIKGIWVIKRLDQGRGFGLSLEPAASGKFIYQDIKASGFTKNSFDETLFQSTETDFLSGVSSARLETSLTFRGTGRITAFSLDASGEYLPFIYSNQRDKVVTSQFDEPVKSSITNFTRGVQFGGVLSLSTGRAGRYSVRGAFYRDQGKVKSSAKVTSGNFEYTFDTFNEGTREDIIGEVIHSMTYVKLFGTLVPALGVTFQRKSIVTSDNSLSSDVYKLAILMETE